MLLKCESGIPSARSHGHQGALPDMDLHPKPPKVPHMGGIPGIKCVHLRMLYVLCKLQLYGNDHLI